MRTKACTLYIFVSRNFFVNIGVEIICNTLSKSSTAYNFMSNKPGLNVE